MEFVFCDRSGPGDDGVRASQLAMSNVTASKTVIAS